MHWPLQQSEVFLDTLADSLCL
jgi:hypothetical protein